MTVLSIDLYSVMTVLDIDLYSVMTVLGIDLYSIMTVHLLFFYKHKGYKHIEARMLAEKQ